MVKLSPKNKLMQNFRSRFPALLSVAIVFLVSAVSLADESTLYKAGKVYTMDGEPLSPGQVLVVDGKISAVGETIDLGDLDPQVVDLGDESVLMPGLVDAYSQSALDASGRNEMSDEVTPDFLVSNAVDWDQAALRRQREQGTTTMCVCPGTQNVFSGISAIIKTREHDAAMLNGDGPLLATMCSDPSRGNQARARPDSVFVRQPTNRMGVVWILRSTFDKSQREDQASNKKLEPVRQVLKGERPVMMVCRLSYDMTSVATLADEFGFSPILVGGQETYKVRETIAELNYPVILQRTSVDQVIGAEGSELVWNQPGVLADAGITFALSGNDLLEQARFAHRHGLDAEQALAAVTSTPAALLGLEKRVGSIQVGADADLIVLNGEPLEMTTSIRQVIVDGESCHQDKE